MIILEFLTAYWRVLAANGFFISPITVVSCAAAIGIVAFKSPKASISIFVRFPLMSLIFAGLIWVQLMILVIGGPPAWVAVGWGFFLIYRDVFDRLFFRLRGAGRDHA